MIRKAMELIGSLAPLARVPQVAAAVGVLTGIIIASMITGHFAAWGTGMLIGLAVSIITLVFADGIGGSRASKTTRKTKKTK